MGVSEEGYIVSEDAPVQQADDLPRTTSQKFRPPVALISAEVDMPGLYRQQSDASLLSYAMTNDFQMSAHAATGQGPGNPRAITTRAASAPANKQMLC